MQFVTQTKFPQRGNCFRACLATLLNINIDFMPPFEEQSDNVWIPAKQWLLYQGLTLCNYHSSFPPDGYSIAVGQSPRNPNIQHAVIALNGVQYFDPHPTRLGLEKIDRYWRIEELQLENKVTPGSSNVYADLGFDRPQEMLEKALTVSRIKTKVRNLGGYDVISQFKGIREATRGLNLESICRGNFRNVEIEGLKQVEKKLDELSKNTNSDPWEQN